MFIFILIFLLIASPAFAAKVFYEPSTGKEVYDVSGEKSKEQIEKDFGMTSVEESVIDSSEGYRISNGKIVKYDLAKEIKDRKKEKEDSLKPKKTRILQKLGLTEEEFQELKDVLQ